jgi:hypothetical protein
MPITLSDLTQAVVDYLNTQVTLTISPTNPAQIKPNANFTFDITVTNPNAVNHGIRLVNVRYHVKVQTPAVAKLVVPATNPDFDGIRYKDPDLVDLAPNAEVAEMYLFPSASSTSSTSSTINRAGDLDVGTSDTIRVTGKGFGSSGTTTGIDCSIKADPDLDYLFPKDEESPSSPATVNIVDA